MIRRPPRSTLTDTLFPYTTRFRSIREEATRLCLMLWASTLSKLTRCCFKRTPFLLLPMDPPATLILTFTGARSEEHTSELQSLMRTSFAVFCLKKKPHRAEEYQNMRNTISNHTHYTPYTSTI